MSIKSVLFTTLNDPRNGFQDTIYSKKIVLIPLTTIWLRVNFINLVLLYDMY